jgi:hypothetical protein
VAMCTLRIDVDAFAREVPGLSLAAQRRSDGWWTLQVGVSNAKFSELDRQIADTVAFLKENAASLRAARAFPGVETMICDFPVDGRPAAAVECNRFPAELLAGLGGLGIELEISRYPKAR